MPKALCIAGTVVAILLFLVFGLDLAVGFPFGRATSTDAIRDAMMLVCAALLGLLSWTTLREQV